jgi:hypothetical protein
MTAEFQGRGTGQRGPLAYSPAPESLGDGAGILFGSLATIPMIIYSCIRTLGPNPDRFDPVDSRRKLPSNNPR